MVVIVSFGLLCLLSTVLAWIDIRDGIIPDWLNLTIAGLGVAWHLGVRLRDFSRRWAFWLETEAGPSLKLAVNVRLDLRIPIRARPRFR